MQYTKVNCFTLYQQWKSGIWNEKHSTIYMSTPPSEILMCNLTIYVKDLYGENYKAVINNIKKWLSKWRDISNSWIGNLNIIKISVLLNLIYNVIHTQTQEVKWILRQITSRSKTSKTKESIKFSQSAEIKYICHPRTVDCEKHYFIIMVN